MKKYLLVFVLATSCVTKRQFTELSKKHDDLLQTNEELIVKNDALLSDKNALQSQLDKSELTGLNLSKQVAALTQEMKAAKAKYQKLVEAYDLLASKSSGELNQKAKENQLLLADLEAKENKLFKEEANLRKLQAALEARSKRIQDLENLIASKEAAMQQLKNAISNALAGFEGNGLTIEKRDGKIYVSMENKLLFESGKWAVGNQGKKAVVELAKVLVKNPTLQILIEGHTDNIPYSKGGVIEDNWDLSVKRATAIVRILEENNVTPTQLIAAGRSEFIPVEENTTKAGRAKNRRIEIVLSPNLDKVTKLLNNQ